VPTVFLQIPQLEQSGSGVPASFPFQPYIKPMQSNGEKIHENSIFSWF
jgi:hypothetical protein